MILSLAMCLRESFNFEDAASELEQAVYQLIKDGKTTKRFKWALYYIRYIQ